MMRFARHALLVLLLALSQWLVGAHAVEHAVSPDEAGHPPCLLCLVGHGVSDTLATTPALFTPPAGGLVFTPAIVFAATPVIVPQARQGAPPFIPR